MEWLDRAVIQSALFGTSIQAWSCAALLFGDCENSAIVAKPQGRLSRKQLSDPSAQVVFNRDGYVYLLRSSLKPKRIGSWAIRLDLGDHHNLRANVPPRKATDVPHVVRQMRKVGAKAGGLVAFYSQRMSKMQPHLKLDHPFEHGGNYWIASECKHFGQGIAVDPYTLPKFSHLLEEIAAREELQFSGTQGPDVELLRRYNTARMRRHLSWGIVHALRRLLCHVFDAVIDQSTIKRHTDYGHQHDFYVDYGDFKLGTSKSGVVIYPDDFIVLSPDAKKKE